VNKMAVVTVFRIVSALVAIIGTTFLIPILVALFCGESAVLLAFIIPMIASWAFFLAVNLPFWKKIALDMRMTFISVALAWIGAGFFGALPLWISGAIPSFTDAVFESVSGFSTTGGTILSEIESLPRSINLWRCMTHWLGGMGIVALTVALLPLLGVGGFQLIKAETTGPEKGKVTPKIATTAKFLWIIYMALTVLNVIFLMIFGMDFVDAISHAFATLGTGGFSSRNASIGAYNSLPIEITTTVFMLLAGVNFSMYYYLISGKIRDVYENSELKAYILICFFSVLFITLSNIGFYGTFGRSLRFSSFQVASIITTTGFATADYTFWNSASQFLIFILFFIGGCSGSTAGGIKVIRWVVLGKQFNNETKRMLHPHGVFSIRLNGNPGRKDIVFSVAAFIMAYIMLVMVTTLVACLGKVDLFSSFTGALSMVGNVGPAFGKLGPSCNYGFLPGFVKWFYSFAMLAGRLELYTMIIYFVPTFWKK